MKIALLAILATMTLIGAGTLVFTKKSAGYSVSISN
jgi:hypothetical protein